MNLIQTSFLFALGALAIPVLVHLLSRWQAQRVELGTMRFLQEVLVESSARQRLRRWLLLATRTALVALLALLFARPYLAEAGKRDGDRLRIVMIDRSASMAMPGAAGRLIDDALVAANSAMHDLGDQAAIVWAWFDGDVQELDHHTAAAPAAPESLNGTTNYLAALSWARDRARREQHASCDIVFITDLQQSGFGADEFSTAVLDFPNDLPVKLIDVGRPAANNLAIIHLGAPTLTVSPENPLTMQATLFNYGALPVEEVTVALTANSGERARRMKKTINLLGDQAQELEFELGVMPPGVWQITVDADLSDDLAIDNRRRLAVNVAEPCPVLVLDPGGEGLPHTQASYFLRTALEQSLEVKRAANKFATTVQYAESGVGGLANDNQRLIVISDASGCSPAQVAAMEQRVRSGAGLLIFAGSTLSPQTAQAFHQAGLSPGQLKTQTSAGASPFRMRLVSTSGLMLEPFSDPQHGDLSRLSFDRVLDCELNPATKVHAWFDTRRAAITEHTVERGRVVWFLSGVSGSANSWTNSPLFLPLVQQMVADLLGLTGEGFVHMRTVGDPATEFTVDSSPKLDSSSVKDVPKQRFDAPGFFTVGDQTFVVNPAPRESDTARRDIESFYKQYGLTPFETDAPVADKLVHQEQRHELWPWLAAMATLLVLTEFFLANRTPA